MIADLESNVTMKNILAAIGDVTKVFDCLGDAISIQDVNFSIVYQNKAMHEMMGSHVGMQCYTAYRGRQEVCPQCPIAMSFEDGSSHTVLVSGEVDDTGTRFVEINASPLKDCEGRIIAGLEICRDVTDRMRTEKELEAAKKRLEKGVAGIAHAVNNPLFSILSLSHILAREMKDPSLRPFVEAMSKEAERMRVLMQEFSLYSRQSALKLDEFVLHNQMEDLLRDMGPKTGTCRITADIPAELRLLADPKRFEMMMRNIIENAVEAQSTRIIIQAELKERKVRIAVSDNGRGIPTNELGEAEEPFFTTKQGSTGLGVSISKRIVEEHGGNFSLQSALGRGTTVTLTLPQ